MVKVEWTAPFCIFGQIKFVVVFGPINSYFIWL